MDKLNELVEMANKATKGTWVADSGEGWDAIISQQDMVNSNFIIGEFIGPDSAVNKDFVLAASPENILAIAEACRALAQRAEAAEAQLAGLAKQKPVGTVSIVRDWNTHRNVATVNMRHDLVVSEMKDGDELFTRAAPATLPVDLVPDVEENEQAFNAGVNALVDCLEDCGDAEQGLRLALRASRAAILRNIEEAK